MFRYECLFHVFAHRGSRNYSQPAVMASIGSSSSHLISPVPKSRWVPDRSAVLCSVCGDAYTFLKRRHHCRACGGVICHNCSATMFLSDGQAHRVCHSCYASAHRPLITLSDEIEANLVRFQALHQMNPTYLPSLRTLALYDVVLVCDDSGSMCTRTENGMTRWDELKQSVQIVVSMAKAFKKSVDVYFLNRGKYLQVSDFEQVEGAFQRLPNGLTPLTYTLRNIWQERRVADDMKRDLIVHVFTDGYPSTFSGAADLDGFEGWLSYRPAIKRTFVAIMLCTDEAPIVNEYRRLEYRERGRFGWTGPTVGVVGVDVTEDYRSEVRDVKATHGLAYKFSFGDYIVKCLVGCVDPMVHAVDMPSPRAGQSRGCALM
jgi:hypothetical protein